MRQETHGSQSPTVSGVRGNVTIIQFDRLIGDKTNGPNPSTSFTFASYGGPIASPISSATLEFGLYDGASPSPSTEVQFFTLNGSDNASVLTAALVADPATRSVETYYTLNLPS